MILATVLRLRGGVEGYTLLHAFYIVCCLPTHVHSCYTSLGRGLDRLRQLCQLLSAALYARDAYVG